MIAEIFGEYVALTKDAWEALTARWVPHDTQDEVVAFVRTWADKTELPTERFSAWLGVACGKFFDRKKRYGKADDKNGEIPAIAGPRHGQSM